MRVTGLHRWLVLPDKLVWRCVDLTFVPTAHCRYIVSVSYFKDNLFVRAFHPITRTTLPYMIRMATVLEIFGVPKSTLPHFYPGILHVDNHRLLGQWLASELSICRGGMCTVQAHAPYHMVGRPALMLEIIEVLTVPL